MRVRVNGKWRTIGAPVHEEFRVPPGANVGEVVLTDREVVVLGSPADSDDEESGHNCDAMGCGSCHVLYRHPFPAPAASPPPDEDAG